MDRKLNESNSDNPRNESQPMSEASAEVRQEPNEEANDTISGTSDTGDLQEMGEAASIASEGVSNQAGVVSRRGVPRSVDMQQLLNEGARQLAGSSGNNLIFAPYIDQRQLTTNEFSGTPQVQFGDTINNKPETSAASRSSPTDDDDDEDCLGDDLLLEAVRLVKKAIEEQLPPETTAPFSTQICKGPSTSTASDTAPAHPNDNGLNPEASYSKSKEEQSSTATTVHPQISKILLFQEKAILHDNRYDPARQNILQKVRSLEKVPFEDFLAEIERKSERLVLLVGAAGSGKTTSSIRLAKKFNEGQNKLCVRMEFKTMGYKKELSLQDLLLEPLNLSEIVKTDAKRGRKVKQERIKAIKDNAFTWIEENDEHLLLIFDGYDQFVSGIKAIPPKTNTTSKMSVDDIVASVCDGNFLKKCRVIVTSRSHALDSLPDELKKKSTTYLLQDLSDKDMMTLLKHLTGDKYAEILQALETKAPHLKAICYNPLLIQMYVAAALNEDPENITSMTRIFQILIENLRLSKNLRGKPINEKVLRSLSEVAFEAINEGSVLISEDLLKKHELHAEQVQGFIFMVPGSDDKKLFDGKNQLFFSHQTLQEYFAALFICKYMPEKKFKKFVRKNLLEGHWFVVSQFLCGLVVDLKESIDDPTGQKNLITTLLVDEMRRLKPKIEEELKHLCTLIRECQDDDAISLIAQSFPTQAFARFDTASEGHAFGCVMKASTHRIDNIVLYSDETSILAFLNEIKEMKGTIGELRLWNSSPNEVSDADAIIPAVTALLPNITNEVKMSQWLEKQNEERIIEWTRKFHEGVEALESDKLPKVVLSERVYGMKLQDNLNYDELVEKLRQRFQVEEIRGNLCITITSQQ